MKLKFKQILILIFTMILLTSCSLPGLSENTEKDIIIAAGSDSERQILAEINKQMIEHYTDLNVHIINNLGSTTLIHTTMLKNEVNMASGMYTGTSLTGELGMEPITDKNLALKTVQQEYLHRYNRIWFAPYGFENTYAFMVRKNSAKKYNLKTVSDLEKLKDNIKLGVDTAWMSRKGDGYEGFKEKYGFSFKHIYPMDLGLLYSAVKNNEMDVILGYSTDGRIKSYDLVLLEDDKKLFPSYDCSCVATAKILKLHPEVKDIILKLSGTINTDKMQEMNRKSAEDLVEPKIVAKEFLEQNNYFENKEVIK